LAVRAEVIASSLYAAARQEVERSAVAGGAPAEE
jgi:hypothetical protein